MRFPAVVVVVLTFALAGIGPTRTASAQDAGGGASAPPSAVGMPGGHSVADTGGDTAGVWGLYAAMGAMVGYVYAVNPVVTTAITTAVAGGVATIWVYDYFVGPPAAAKAK